MIITILGSGTSGGVPMIGCPCSVCSSDDPRDKRLRSAVMVQQNNTTIVIDAGPDFRQQMLREKVRNLDAIVFTHAHRDHTAGLDDVRAFNFFLNRPMDIYCTPAVEASLRKEYHYVFEDAWYPGLPQINFITIDTSLFSIGDIRLQPIEVLHFKLKVFGYRIGNFTYITDANFIAEEEMEKIKGSEVLVINALRREQHMSHFNLQEALDMAFRIGAKQTYLTHISHQMGLHREVEKDLPENVLLAYDGLRIEL